MLITLFRFVVPHLCSIAIDIALNSEVAGWFASTPRFRAIPLYLGFDTASVLVNLVELSWPTLLSPFTLS